MIGNPNIFSTYQTYKAPTAIIVVHGSKYNIMRYGTIRETSSINFSSALNLPKFAFKLIFMGKLTRDLNYYVSFFPYYCFFRDLVTHKFIGKGHVIDSLYILDEYKSRFIAYSSVVPPFGAHCQLGHPSVA